MGEIGQKNMEIMHLDSLPLGDTICETTHAERKKNTTYYVTKLLRSVTIRKRYKKTIQEKPYYSNE